jgi:uncharacterized protein
MKPLRFGPSKRELFGLYQPALSAPRGQSILLCNPFGQEAIRCHRLYKVLADRLTGVGFHVMRFDYFATGDSAGADEEADIQIWLDNIGSAHQELESQSAAPVHGWFGLRLGGTLAMLASARVENRPAQIVAWDPIFNGAAYLGELRAAHLTTGEFSYGIRWTVDEKLRESVLAEADSEALGFPLTSPLTEQVKKIELASFDTSLPTRLDVIDSHDVVAQDEVKTHFAGQPKKVRFFPTTNKVDWASNEAMNSSIVSIDVMQRVVSSMLGTND